MIRITNTLSLYFRNVKWIFFLQLSFFSRKRGLFVLLCIIELLQSKLLRSCTNLKQKRWHSRRKTPEICKRVEPAKKESKRLKRSISETVPFIWQPNVKFDETLQSFMVREFFFFEYIYCMLTENVWDKIYFLEYEYVYPFMLPQLQFHSSV